MPNTWPRETRLWIYSICLALGALAVGLNWAGEHTIALIMGVIGAILGPTVAIPNVPPADPATGVDGTPVGGS